MNDDLPPEPGTSPVPKGHVRLFHYTATKNLPEIRRHGLIMARARGETYGEPNQIWAAAGVPPAEHFATHNYVEFHAHPNELAIGHYGGRANRETPPDEALRAHVSFLEERRAHVTLGHDVPRSDILAIHEPWHHHVRYLRQNAEYYRQHPDFLEGDFGDDEVSRAVRYYKQHNPVL
jgi:hypothetical protein